MSTYTEVLPERKGSKRGAVRFTPAAGEYEPVAGVMAIDTGRSSAEYLVTEFPTGWDGRGFQLDKLAGGTDAEAGGYAVFCGRGARASCECRGFLRWGNCKHADAVEACRANGWL